MCIRDRAYGESVEWADGRWVQDPETGENFWQPADGSTPISEADYMAMQEAEAEAASAEGSDDAAEGSDDAAEGGEGAAEAVSDDEYAEDEGSDDPAEGSDDEE